MGSASNPILATATAIALAALAAGCANPGRSRALGDPSVSGTTLAQQVCSNCHGLHGVAVSPNFPNLAAQQPDYLVGELTSFRDRHRRDPAGFEYMWGISRRLTDAQIQDLARYFSSQPPAHAPYAGDDAQLAQGRALFSQGAAERGVPACASCHGEKAQGAGGFPRLAGQHADYVVKQLTIFQRSGDERPLGQVMTVVGHKLTVADIRAVASYVESL
jgi:cytochrome c553